MPMVPSIVANGKTTKSTGKVRLSLPSSLPYPLCNWEGGGGHLYHHRFKMITSQLYLL